MNIQHLKYVVEIEKTGSITRAAENLYMGQPNLSKAIKELESAIGITIFKRTPKGVIPTMAGRGFLIYAENIIAQVEELEKRYQIDDRDKLTFRICIPRSSYVAKTAVEFVAGLDGKDSMEVSIRETNSMRAIKEVADARRSISVIRYQTMYEEYFTKYLKERDLVSELIWEFEYCILISKQHPLACEETIRYEDLKKGIEIAHGDMYVPNLPLSEIRKIESMDVPQKRIFIYERGSQFELLRTIPNSFMWVSPVPNDLLERNDLIQRYCKKESQHFKDQLIYRCGYKPNALENSFLEKLYEHIEKLKKIALY